MEDRAENRSAGWLSPYFRVGEARSINRNNSKDVEQAISYIFSFLEKIDGHQKSDQHHQTLHVITTKLRYFDILTSLGISGQSGSIGSEQKNSQNLFPNPARVHPTSEKLGELRLELVELVSRLIEVNTDEDFELRQRLISLLKMLLICLGEGLKNPPDEIPIDVPRESRDIAKLLEKGANTSTSARKIYENISAFIEGIFSGFPFGG